MKFKPTIDIWSIPEESLKTLQRGQWVSAGPVPQGDRRACGVFCGVRPSGTVVVAWNGNARASKSPKAYRKALMDYGRA